MIIVAPITETEHNITFSPSSPKTEVIEKLNLPEDFNWISFDKVVKFKNVPRRFFEYALNQTKNLLENYGADWSVCLAALNVTAQKYNDLLSLAIMDMESTLSSLTLRPIIHYTTGFPPYFSKNTFDSEIKFAKDPYTCLLSFNPNFCTDYVRQVIQSYQGVLP
jgi:hypothetical protein